jgi:cytoskeleton protein RodZ
MIEALESDDFANLPEPVFTQGYLRNYARLLGLPENEVLDAYQRIRPRPDTGEASIKGTHTVKPEVRSSHRLVQLVTWLIVLGLLGLVIIWWQDQLHWQSEPMVEEPTTPAAQDIPTTVMEDEVSLEPEVRPQAVTPFVSDLGTTREDTAVATAPDQSSSPQAEEITPAEPTTAAVSLPTPPSSAAVTAPGSEAEVDTPPAQTVSLPPAEPATPQVTQPESLQPMAAPGLMVFEFTGACWAEVRDSTGKAHIIGEMGAGDRRTVPSNLGPYKIVLGNVKFARLTIDGKPFDLASQTKGVVARFTLDPKQL